MDLIGPYLIGCLLLAVAGVMKAWRPDDTARALAAWMSGRLRPLVQFPLLRTVIRLVALGEAGLGLVALVLPRQVTAALVAASYLVFAGVVATARSRGGALASCGCFGRPDTPATLLHAAVDLVLGTAAAAVALTVPASGSVLTALAHQPVHGVPLVCLSVVGAGVTYLTLSLLPALQAVRSAGASRGTAALRR